MPCRKSSSSSEPSLSESASDGDELLRSIFLFFFIFSLLPLAAAFLDLLLAAFFTNFFRIFASSSEAELSADDDDDDDDDDDEAEEEDEEDPDEEAEDELELELEELSDDSDEEDSLDEDSLSLLEAFSSAFFLKSIS